MAKTNKQTNKKGKKSFFQVGPALSIVGTGHSSYFLNSLNPVIPFINVTDWEPLDKKKMQRQKAKRRNVST